MAEKIYIRNAGGEIEPLVEERFETEELLQELIGQHPELLGGDQMRPADPLRWILIRREMPVEGWAVDHLLIDQDARPTLVEVKRGSNREIRRNIVGQMLDYAATAAGVWSGDGMKQAFEEDATKRGADPFDELTDLLQLDDESTAEEMADEFWVKASTNLDANRLRLLFVADEIPAELERVVKFLNEQTRDNLEVLAIEVKQYPGQFGDALVSRVIGQNEASSDGNNGSARRQGSPRHRMSVEEFLDKFEPVIRGSAEKLIVDARAVGGVVRGSPASIRIGGPCPIFPRNINIAQFYPPTDSDEGSFTFRVGQGFDIPEVRAFLQEWIAQFEAYDFTEKYEPTNWQTGWTIKPADVALHVDDLSVRLRDGLIGLTRL